MSNEQRSVTFFQKRGLLFKEKISVYFFVNEQVLNLINPKGYPKGLALKDSLKGTPSDKLASSRPSRPKGYRSAYRTSLSIVQCSLINRMKDQ